MPNGQAELRNIVGEIEAAASKILPRLPDEYIAMVVRDSMENVVTALIHDRATLAVNAILDDRKPELLKFADKVMKAWIEKVEAEEISLPKWARSEIDKALKEKIQDIHGIQKERMLSVYRLHKAGVSIEQISVDLEIPYATASYILEKAKQIILKMRRELDALDGNISPASTKTPLNGSGLDARTTRCLQDAGLNFWEDLESMSHSEILSIKNLGRKSLNSILNLRAALSRTRN